VDGSHEWGREGSGDCAWKSSDRGKRRVRIKPARFVVSKFADRGLNDDVFFAV